MFGNISLQIKQFQSEAKITDRNCLVSFPGSHASMHHSLIPSPRSSLRESLRTRHYPWLIYNDAIIQLVHVHPIIACNIYPVCCLTHIFNIVPPRTNYLNEYTYDRCFVWASHTVMSPLTPNHTSHWL